ncbi:hypothetical protein CF327_g5215 [Tilletia walkeri]|uniref:Uncharacterized protein n=1 Tax=Tilletia walkeri TaxID=117179 RepID=A0A8X7T0W5_9BASI|nr:hypothetical protein CF327_g5215 [Tilletia walkeri]KAE8261994.1 hypothetical protein A4X09_0g7558 [Tilletia walkeri]
MLTSSGKAMLEAVGSGAIPLTELLDTGAVFFEGPGTYVDLELYEAGRIKSWYFGRSENVAGRVGCHVIAFAFARAARTSVRSEFPSMCQWIHDVLAAESTTMVSILVTKAGVGLSDAAEALFTFALGSFGHPAWKVIRRRCLPSLPDEPRALYRTSTTEAPVWRKPKSAKTICDPWNKYAYFAIKAARSQSFELVKAMTASAARSCLQRSGELAGVLYYESKKESSWTGIGRRFLLPGCDFIFRLAKTSELQILLRYDGQDQFSSGSLSKRQVGIDYELEALRDQ